MEVIPGRKSAGYQISRKVVLPLRMVNLYQPTGTSYRDAVFEALLDKFYTDPTLIAYGEKTETGAAHSPYTELTEALLSQLFNSPISRRSNCGFCVDLRHVRRRAVVGRCTVTSLAGQR